MRFLATLVPLIAGASALGINCRGSGACGSGGLSLNTILTQVQQLQAEGNGGHEYAEGVQIACSQGQFFHMCAFFQNGASGTADRAAELIQGLLDHGCSACGSNPTQDGNNVDDGELTVNVVDQSCCKGDCTCPI